MPAGLRSQTPISHTASKPNSAMASHTEGGTEPRSTGVPTFSLSSESQTQVLISYTLGYLGHVGMIGTHPHRLTGRTSFTSDQNLFSIDRTKNLNQLRDHTGPSGLV